MKLAYVSPRYPKEGAVGGCETLLRNVAEHAAHRGHEVHFLTTCATNHFSWDNAVPAGVEKIGPLQVHFFPVNENRDIETFLEIQGRIDARDNLSLKEEMAWITNSVNSDPLIQHLRDTHYDAIMAGPYLFGITHTVATTFPERTHLVPCLHDESYAYLKIVHNMFHQVKGLLFNSEPERQLAVRLYEMDPGIGHIVGMGMTPFESDGNRFRRKHNLDEPYLIYCGRREAGKGTPLMLDYMHLYRERTERDVKLVLTGSGDVHPHPDLAPHVLDLGYASEQDKVDAMAGALAFFHPSLNESFGIVALEAWLAGTPVIVHNKCPVLQHLAEAGNGGLWFDHYPHFEGILNALLDEPGLADSLGNAGQRYARETYDWHAVGDRLFAALEA